MFESLIVPVDESSRSRRALEVASVLAKQTGSKIDLLEVTSPGLDTVDDEVWLDDVAAGLDAPVGSRTVVESDDVVHAIADAQIGSPRSLVVMGTHAHTGLAELVLGGYAGEVLRSSTRPVLLVGPYSTVPARFDVVQVCVDGSPESATILPAAEAFARRTDGRLFVVEVLPPSTSGDPGETNTVASTARRISLETDVFAEWEVLHGRDVPAALVDHARRIAASVIALATRGRSGTTGRILGSVAMRVAHDSPVPVLVARAR
jgi:nucleotide-binding universal stress UspA family protein